MDVRMPFELATGYASSCQKVRVVTEAWGERELFCADCDSGRLKRTPHNTRSVDLFCQNCNSTFQLKAGRGQLPRIIPDGAYAAMVGSIRENRTPNLLLLRYDSGNWNVISLVLIPKFAFPESSIIRRKPLADTARRAGWVGCNISLDRIPQDARIPLVVDGIARDRFEVRTDVNRLRPLTRFPSDQRGWALEILNFIRTKNLKNFSTSEIYQFGNELQMLHPENHHIRPKIRQQLQVLRDSGFLLHLSRGRWEVK